jgi:hypothetical protein
MSLSTLDYEFEPSLALHTLCTVGSARAVADPLEIILTVTQTLANVQNNRVAAS